MLLHWFVTFWGNLCGSLFMVAIILGYGVVFSADPYKSEVISFATKKQVTPDFHEVFLRGIGCNWLVCLACFFGIQGRDLTSKVIGIWWPVFAFVSLGFDHVVANMTFIPMAIWLDAPGISVGLYIWKGIIPALIGNIIGGGLFCGKSSNHIYCQEIYILICVGGYYFYMYGLEEETFARSIKGLGKSRAASSEDIEASGAEGPAETKEGA